MPESYAKLLGDLKNRIQNAQIKAALSVNQELIKLYWDIGNEIVKRQKKEKWGSKVIEKLAHDLQTSFPGIQGFSRSNIFRIRAFYTAYEKVAQAARQTYPPDFCLQIPWWHNIILLERLPNIDQRIWYAQKVLENGWSRSVLETWIDSDLYSRQGKAITNFQAILPKPQSDLAEQTLRDPYCFDFLTLTDKAREKDIEAGLVTHIQNFLTELGVGFAFVGKQYPLVIEGDTFYIDLLFYHLHLRCYVVIELKAKEFDPRDTGQLNFYLSAVDDVLRHPSDQPTIGLLLCKTKKKLKVEYAIRDLKKPIGIASYETKIVESLPQDLKGVLPTVAEIEAEFKGDFASA